MTAAGREFQVITQSVQWAVWFFVHFTTCPRA